MARTLSVPYLLCARFYNTDRAKNHYPLCSTAKFILAKFILNDVPIHIHTSPLVPIFLICGPSQMIMTFNKILRTPVGTNYDF